MAIAISEFRRVAPPLLLSQSYALEWLREAHEKALAADPNDPPNSKEQLLARLQQIAEGASQIHARGSWCEDFASAEAGECKIFTDQEPQGACLGVRARVYQHAVEQIFQDLYPSSRTLPDHLLHVSCTGYVSPSAPQRLVAQRQAPTHVTHLYHMGCGAALPAIRLAASACQPSSWQPWGRSARVDCVHTELCTLHLNPSQHDLSELVVQALFADGAIAYSVHPAQQGEQTQFVLEAHREELLPGTAHAMTWELRSWGFAMTLGREVPVYLKRALPGFMERLAEQANQSVAELVDSAYWAIHPGGPRIVEQVASRMNLQPWQTEHSRAILRQHGNMSSATLPHVWQSLLEDSQVPYGAQVVTLAFGPGLTLAGALLRKQMPDPHVYQRV
jgi:predicted naringenin-chalcone synthase